MKTTVSQYIADFVAKLGTKRVYTVTGGGAMFLNDALGFHPGFATVCMHHEQSCAFAAEADARISGGIGVLHVTSGPGGTNAITGICGGWIDSIPMLAISGQASLPTTIGNSGLRQKGVQEADIVSMVKPITKYAVMVTAADEIRYHMEKAAHLAVCGRPGPVWIDVPTDVSNFQIDPDGIPGYRPEPPVRPSLAPKVRECLALLEAAERPVLIPGYGVRLAGATQAFRELAEKLQMPIVPSWNASDIVGCDSPYHVGRAGIFGDRAGNFAVQNADLLVIVGSRMSIPQTGYNAQLFARGAKMIVVDIDPREHEKPTLRPTVSVVGDAGDFLKALLAAGGNFRRNTKAGQWLAKCQDWRARYPVVLDEYRREPDKVNSYHFIERLSERLPDESVVVTDMGTSFSCTMQTFATKAGQRLFTSSGLAAMGFGLPGAIGACFANGRRRTICLSGDGGLMFNLQELQTVIHYKLPIVIFVLNNEGYLTMKHTQKNYFGRLIGSEPASGVSCPDFVKVAAAFGIPGAHIRDRSELESGIGAALAAEGPYVCEVHMPVMQALVPRVQNKRAADGRIVPTPIEDLYPFLDREEFERQMIVPPVKV